MPMEEVSAQLQNHHTAMDKVSNVVLDIDAIAQQPEKCCSGGPQLSRSLSQKSSNRTEKWSNHEQEADDTVKKPAVKVMRSPLDQFKQSPLKKTTPPLSRTTSPMFQDSYEGRLKRLQGIIVISPRKVLLTFATMSSVGSMVLIYFTLAINRKAIA